MTASLAIPTAALVLPITEATLNAITEGVYQRLQSRLPDSRPSPWMTVTEVAAYLACKPDRIYSLKSAGRIPHYKDGSRLLFERGEIDEWVRAGGGIRP